MNTNDSYRLMIKLGHSNKSHSTDHWLTCLNDFFSNYVADYCVVNLNCSINYSCLPPVCHQIVSKAYIKPGEVSAGQQNLIRYAALPF